MARRKLIKQRGPTDCGVAVLATLAGVSYEEARAAIWEAQGYDPTGRRGTRGKSGIVAAARALGLKPASDRLVRAKDWESVPAGSMVRLKHVVGRGGHLVVKLKDGRCWDPWFGVVSPRPDERGLAARVTSYTHLDGGST